MQNLSLLKAHFLVARRNKFRFKILAQNLTVCSIEVLIFTCWGFHYQYSSSHKHQDRHTQTFGGVGDSPPHTFFPPKKCLLVGPLWLTSNCTFFPITTVPWWGVGDLLTNSPSSELKQFARWLHSDFCFLRELSVLPHQSVWVYSTQHCTVWALKAELIHYYSHFALSNCFTGTLWWGNYRILQKTNSTMKPLPDSPSGWTPASATESLCYNITKLMMFTKSPVAHTLCSPTTDLP